MCDSVNLWTVKSSVVYNNRKSTLSSALLVSCFFVLYFSSVELIMLESELNLKLISIRSWQFLQCESKKISPLGDLIFFHFFTNGWEFVIDFFTHLLNVPIFARLQIFIQLFPILTKWCHIKRDYQVHIICAKCPKRTKTHAFRRLRKSLIALLIVVCGK